MHYSIPQDSGRRLPQHTDGETSISRELWKHPPRVQGFEFCDQSFLKGIWREAYLDGLNFLFRVGGAYRNMHKPYSQWAQHAGNARVLDLASGGAGPIQTMLDAAKREGTPLPRITLSDLHPDRAAFEKVQAAHPDHVDFIATSVDALSANHAQFPLRSICTGFHHFTPKQVTRLLKQVTQESDGVFLLEPMPCSWGALLMSLPSFFVLLLASFFAPRFSFWKFLFTTLVPLVPLMIVWDGVVSALRMYRPEEILALLPKSARTDWEWKWGSERYLLFYRATYFHGRRIHGRRADEQH